MKHLFRRAGAAILAAALAIAGPATACTGISLRASDGSVVVARTVEWALSDAAHDRLMVFPRRHAFVGTTPDGLTGMRWEGRHGFVTMTAYGQPFGPDGMMSGVSSLDPALIVQRPRTPAFQAGNTGSNPVGGTLGAW